MKLSDKLYTFLFFSLALLSYGDFCAAQSYGLAFAGSEVVQDARTGLDLSPGTSLCFKKDFDLSFDLSFLPDQKEYFGYIVRLIDEDKRNIDIIYDNNPSSTRHFKIVVGEHFSNFPFEMERSAFYRKWNRIVLRFKSATRSLEVGIGDKFYTQKVAIKENTCFKILFGANNYGDFKTTDVPPMVLRDIRISEGTEPRFRWLLDEKAGDKVPDVINDQQALVTNPQWIKKMHSEWKLLQKFKTKGAASVAFDPEKEAVYVVGLDSLYSYLPSPKRLTATAYRSGRLDLLRGNQAYYDPATQRLYDIYIDQNVVSAFNFATSTWSKNFKSPDVITDNWQFNKLYSPHDSSFYILGGYGHFTYKNEVKQLHLPSGEEKVHKAKGDFFTPRYLAALGKTEGGAYILGGYGSSSGQQILNPRNLYDLLYFNVEERSFKKVYELKIPGEDFVFANSLVIDKKNDAYYGLIFPKHKYQSNLQLVKGSLSKKSFVQVGDQIPYLFHDINSFSDLYYCPASQRFIAVTLFLNDNNETEVAIYSLAGPPLPVTVEAVAGFSFFSYKTLAMAFGLFLIAVILYRLVKGKWGPGMPAPQAKTPTPQLVPAAVEEPGTSLAQQPVSPAAVPVVTEAATPEPAGLVSTTTELRSTVLLFGDFQLFDAEGIDITKYFTPLIRELFLVVLLYTIRWERGISSEKLKELLWFDKSAESARNNRSVNIAKLKTILDRMKFCQISKDTGNWKINIDYEHIHVDYRDYLCIVKDKKKLDKQKIKELADIIQRGSFLSDLEYEWLDSFKSEISNEIIDTYLHFAHSTPISEDPEFLIKIASYIFYFDSVNEEAMTLKCKALVYLGKHSLAKTAFENFRKEYKAIYGEEFGKDFHGILE